MKTENDYGEVLTDPQERCQVYMSPRKIHIDNSGTEDRYWPVLEKDGDPHFRTATVFKNQRLKDVNY